VLRLGRSTRRDLLLLFAATGGALAWTVQLWLGWLVDDLGCRVQPGEFVLLGLGTAGLWILIGLATGLLALAASWVAWRLMRVDQPVRDVEIAGDAHGARRFVATAGLALNLLLLGTIALGTTSPLFVPPCA
jgi:hypothetical protein